MPDDLGATHPRGGEPAPSIGRIQALVCAALGLSRSAMTASGQDHRRAHARQLAMLLARELTGRSSSEIGRLFGNRDHTTVLYACRVARERAERDPVVATLFGRLADQLRAEAVHRCGCADCSRGADRFPLDPPQLHLPINLPGELPFASTERLAA